MYLITKILIIVIFCIGLVSARADTVCLRDVTAMFTIKKSINPISYTVSGNTFTLNMNYDVLPGKTSRTLMGAATCNEITTKTDGSAAKSGDVNTHLRASDGDVGVQCWCSLTGPVTTWWVFYKTYSDASVCASSCAQECATVAVSNKNNFRTSGLYLAIW